MKNRDDDSGGVTDIQKVRSVAIEKLIFACAHIRRFLKAFAFSLCFRTEFSLCFSNRLFGQSFSPSLPKAEYPEKKVQFMFRIEIQRRLALILEHANGRFDKFQEDMVQI
jgi:hypothetical protein